MKAIPKKLSVQEVSQLTDLSCDVIRKQIRTGKLPAFRFGNGHYRIYREDVEQLLTELEVKN
jgi:excisionase family DNA binding protein